MAGHCQATASIQLISALWFPRGFLRGPYADGMGPLFLWVPLLQISHPPISKIASKGRSRRSAIPARAFLSPLLGAASAS
jgi:hypothetical protein